MFRAKMRRAIRIQLLPPPSQTSSAASGASRASERVNTSRI
nr:MAG TPA: hypothetical protein [Caudoviricetes sp.]